jgi:uncharacterized protein DUF2877
MSRIEVDEDMIAFKCESVGILHKYIRKPTAERNLAGTVISAFPTSLNIKTSRNELLVISLNNIRSPITINLMPQYSNSNFAGRVDYGDHVVRFRYSVFVGESLELHPEKGIVFSNCFVKPTHAALNEFSYAAEKILSSLMELRRSGCMLEPEITNQGLLHQFIADTLENSSKNNDNAKFVRTLSHSLMKMCGRGPGFTPSGDDFICGFASLFNWLSRGLKYPPISLPKKRVCNQTTWISFKFIEYYQKLIVDEQIQALINSIGEGRTDHFMLLISMLSCRGHTSGIDIGTGLSIALFTLCDRSLGTNLLPNVQTFSEGVNRQKDRIRNKLKSNH